MAILIAVISSPRYFEGVADVPDGFANLAAGPHGLLCLSGDFVGTFVKSSCS
jgi:hypothetical protein